MNQIKKRKLKPFQVFGIAVFLILTIFTLVVVAINVNLREEIRNQIINRDAETIYLFTMMDRSAENIEKISETVAPWIQKNNSLTPSLWSSDLKGIIALQIFDTHGELKSKIPGNLIPAALKREDFRKLQQLIPVSKFHEEIWLYSLFDDPRFMLMDSPVPLLEVIIPVNGIKSKKLDVILQYWIEGNSMSEELSRLNNQILVKTIIALGVGNLTILTVFMLAYRQLKAASNSLFDEIEQRKLIEKELKRFRLVLDQAGEAIFITNISTGQIIDVNDAACRQLRYDRDELLKRNIAEINLNYLPTTGLSLQLEKADAEIGFIDEGIHYRKDGSTYPVEVSVSSKTIDNQNFLLTVARDITERKQAEEALKKIHSELEERVVERTIELKRKTDELKREVEEGKLKEEERRQLEIQLYQTQKMESLGTLAGGFAHDFNTLIGTIIGYAEIISNEVPQDSEIVEYLNTIKSVSFRAKTLVKQIGDFSRPKTTDKVPMNTRILICSSIEFIKSILPKTIQIQEDYCNDVLIINANEDQINQLMVNICSNAGDFIEDGIGILKVKTEKIRKNELSAYPSIKLGDYMKLSISDSGSGIDPEKIDEIFDPFFTTKEVGKGSGLGLSIVHNIVKNHNGQIFVESVLGAGTTFQIFLPIIEGGLDQTG